MSFTPCAKSARRIAPWLIAAGLTLGCSETAELASALSDGKEREANAGREPRTGAAVPPGSSPAPRAMGAAPGDPNRPANPATGSGGGADCKMRMDGNRVCVTCVDAAGRVVRDDCFDRGGNPMGGDQCAEARQPDGSVCLICRDSHGTTVIRGCQTPPSPPSTCVPPAPNPPICKDTVINGIKCTICTDPNGREVRRWCQGMAPTPPPPPGNQPGGVTCEETSHPDGTTCAVCTDAAGNIVKKGCWGPVPEPPAPPMVTCRDYMENGARCTICVDSQGMVVKQGCAAPTPPGPVPPPPPPPPPASVTCHTFQNPNSVCVICFDEAGKIVKQDCHPSANGR